MSKVYISVNKHKIASNARCGTNDPPISIRFSKSGKPIYTDHVTVTGGKVELLYCPDKPILKCGARLVMTVENEENIEWSLP